MSAFSLLDFSLLEFSLLEFSLLGLAAWFFLVVNLAKTPFSVSLGLISLSSLRLDRLILVLTTLSAIYLVVS